MARVIMEKAMATMENMDIMVDIDKAEIKVEYKHIDVLIYDGKKYIIIENKVNHACDQDKQIEKE